MKLRLEFKAAEGGEDSRLFLLDLVSVYEKAIKTGFWKSRRIAQRPGYVLLEITGDNLPNLAKTEAGGHRIQRVPPTERRGRVHTSTVTISVFGDKTQKDSPYLLRDGKHFRTEVFKSSGPGGQNRNKVSSGIKCIHLPTGTKEERVSKSQHRNRKDAKIAVIARLDQLYAESCSGVEARARAEQRGSGQRGDKIRTYRLQDNRVIDHRTGRKTTWEKLQKGALVKFWG